MLVIRDRAHLSIGREFSVQVPATEQQERMGFGGWKSGTGYNYGMLPPRYPVPAIPLDVEITPNGVFLHTWGTGKNFKSITL